MWKERLTVTWAAIADVECRQAADAGVHVVLDGCFGKGWGAMWYIASGWRCAVHVCA